MAALIWNPETVWFQDAQVRALVARSPRADVLEREMELKKSTLAKDETLILRYPPLIVGNVIGYTPKGKPMHHTTCPDIELWRVCSIGSFDSIRFAKVVFNAPEDKYFREGVGSIEAIIAMLAEGFEEGAFRLNHVNPAMLSFELTMANAKLTHKQHALLDRLNERFFYTDSTRKHMKSVYANAPGSFSIGAV